MEIILTPPIAFIIYIPLVVIIALVGRSLASSKEADAKKSSLYASGELAPTNMAAPGYRPFFLIAFFFAILHLGMLVLGSGTYNGTAAIYIAGLLLALAALTLG